MNPASNPDYKRLISELIKKQVVILGPNITYARVGNVPGLTLDQNGEVQSISRDPKTVFDELSNQFVELSSQIVKKTMESLLQSDQANEGKSADSNQTYQNTTQIDHNIQNQNPVGSNADQMQGKAASYNPDGQADSSSPDQQINPLSENVQMPNENLEGVKEQKNQDFTLNELDNLNRSLKDEVMGNISKSSNPPKQQS